jgi:hypothetical protein
MEYRLLCFLVVVTATYAIAVPMLHNTALFEVSRGPTKGFLWSSIGLAVFAVFLQGLVTALAQMTESSS